MTRSVRLSRYWGVFPPLMLTSQLIFYHIPVLQKMQIYLKVSRVIGSSDYSIFILRYVHFNVAIAILRLSQVFTEYIINCSELEGSQWSVFRQLTISFFIVSQKSPRTESSWKPPLLVHSNVVHFHWVNARNCDG